MLDAVGLAWLEVAWPVVAVIALLGVVYLRFLPAFFRYLFAHLVQASILGLLFALLYGQVGNGLGLPLLFWSEEPWTRFTVALASTLLLAVLGLTAYYLMSPELRQRIMRRAFCFLGELPGEERNESRPVRWLCGVARRVGLDRLARRARRVTAVLLVDHPRLEPRGPGPAGEGEASDTYQLGRFLRLVRLPFLVLLALPAALPDRFESLPRFAPIVVDIQERAFLGDLFWGEICLGRISPDETRYRLGYAFALVVWLAGMWAGVVAVKLTLRAVDLVTRGRCDARRSVRLYFVVAMLAYVALALPPLYDGVAPAVAILALMGMASLLSALFARLTHVRRSWRLPSILALLLVVSCNNGPTDSYRFENLRYDDHPVALDPEVAHRYLEKSPTRNAPPDRSLVADGEALEAWKRQCAGSAGAPGGRPKLVVVCTSGGAIRAGYWTATVLDRLGHAIDRRDGASPSTFRGDFHTHVRVISGASGGMVGASYYVDWLSKRGGPGCPVPDDAPQPSAWIRGLPIFSLDRVARSIALRDPAVLLLRMPLNCWLGLYSDRGRVLERDWEALRRPIADLRERERCGSIPSLIFSPMTVEDGRRLLISNLDLETLYRAPTAGESGATPPRPIPAWRHLAVNRAGQVEAPEDLRPASLSAVEFFKVFPRVDEHGRPANDLLLSTAARMSATFPFLSPAVALPSEPPLRVVDAGYYDNYGIDVAAAWLFANRFWIREHTSGVLVVQIRDALSRGDRLEYPPADRSPYAWALRGLQFFFSPLDGASRSRYSSSSFRNDAVIAALSDLFAEATGSRAFLTTAVFELASRTIQPIRGMVHEWPGDKLGLKIELADTSQATEVAMSWYLTVAERQAIDMAIPRVIAPRNFDTTKYRAGEGTPAEDLARALGVDEVPGVRPVDIRDERGRRTRVEDLRILAARVRELAKPQAAWLRPRLPAERAERVLYVIDKELARSENHERLHAIEAWWPVDWHRGRR